MYPVLDEVVLCDWPYCCSVHTSTVGRGIIIACRCYNHTNQPWGWGKRGEKGAKSEHQGLVVETYMYQHILGYFVCLFSRDDNSSGHFGQPKKLYMCTPLPSVV